MSNVKFINNAYTEDGLKLPMIHFESKERAKMFQKEFTEESLLTYLKVKVLEKF